ncbi:hypothetical protein WJX72_002291 [[Myrmecia] bisecta]|uniref:Uncharacterized protein n=1 Tax=[Myrmecia] bisecta TaxID=41462 RepID=A0AAW1Q6N0_9CHLO
MARVLKLPSGKRLNVQHMPPPSESGTSPSRPLNLKPSQVVLDGTLLDSVPEAGGAKQPVAGSKQLHTSRAVPWPAAAQVRLLAEGIAVPRLQPFHLRRNPQAQILYCDLERCVSPYLDIELGSHRTESRQSIGPLGPLSPHPLSPSLLKICRPGTASSNPDSDSNPGPFWPSFDDLPEMESLWRAPSMSSGGQHTSRSDDARAPLSPLNLDQLRNSKDSSRDCMTARTFSTASAGTPKSVRSV